MAPPLRTAGLRGAMLGWDGQLEDDARLVDDGRPHGRVVRRARPHPRPGAERDRHRRCRCATSSPATTLDGHRTHGRQRDRRLGRRPGRRGHAAPQPRHPPGAARGLDARAPGRGLRAGAGRRRTGSCWCCPSPTARSTSASPTSRSTVRCPDVPEPTEPEIGFLLDVVSRGVRPAAAPRPTWSAPTPGCGRCSTPATPARPPTCPASTPCSPAGPAWSRSSAAS